MVFSGFRISAFTDIKIDLEENIFTGGVKTAAGKDRTVPIHPLILPFVLKYNGKSWLTVSVSKYRNEFYSVLEGLGIANAPGGEKHTPHDCRHTFSWLCDKYGMDSLSKHLLMGHALGKDVEDNVYGHRTLDELRSEIAKLQIP